MKSEQLFYALTDIHDRFIEEAAEGIPKKNRQVYLRYGVLAASLLLVCGLGGLSLRGCGASGRGSSMPNEQTSGTHDNVYVEDVPARDGEACEDGAAAEGTLPSEAPAAFAAQPQDAGTPPSDTAPPISGTETAPSAPRPAAPVFSPSQKGSKTQTAPETIPPRAPSEQAPSDLYTENHSISEENAQTEMENDDAALQTAKCYSAGADTPESAGAGADYAQDAAASNALPQADIQYYPALPLLSLAEGRLSATRDVVIDLSAYPETSTLQYQDCYTLENSASSSRAVSLLYPDAAQVSITANGTPLSPTDMEKITIPANSNMKIVISGSKTLPISPGSTSRLEIMSAPNGTLDFTSQSATLIPCSGLEFYRQNFGFDLASGKLSVSLQTEESYNFLEFSCP